jgi:TPP-dependent pyruvate/acetoin dehydrogenase alpha subunit
VEEEVNKAVEFAETSPEPALEDLFKDIYAEEVEK